MPSFSRRLPYGLTLLAPLALAACSSSGAGLTGLDEVVDTDLLVESGYTLDPETQRIAEEVADRGANADMATVLPVSGVGTYNGEFGAVIDRDPDHSSIYGDTEIMVNFGNRNVSGEFTPVEGRDSESPASPFAMTGTLVVDGLLTGSEIDGTLAGEIYAGAIGPFNVDTDLDGAIGGGSTGVVGTFDGDFSFGTTVYPIEGVYYAE
ncbi:hypothetical protein [Pseudoroseicyclus sp. CXY001]|uniref:hypothetical protein n=1 Tax=Pseudoroseicyclus sp. CXY001 TaxID=3242492 RepID=UPI00358DD11F